MSHESSAPIVTRDPRTVLRFAGREDVPTILALIRGLADYEKLLSECVADEERLAETLFGERRFAIRATPVVQENGGRQGCKPDSRVPKNANVRILAQSGAWCGVDVDEDGDADGHVRTADLTPSLATMPPWGPSS